MRSEGAPGVSRSPEAPTRPPGGRSIVMSVGRKGGNPTGPV